MSKYNIVKKNSDINTNTLKYSIDSLHNINNNLINFINFINNDKHLMITINYLPSIFNKNNYSTVNYDIFFKMVYSIVKIITNNFTKTNNIEISIASNIETLNNIKYLSIEFSNNDTINLKTINKIYQTKTLLLSNNLNYNIKFFNNLVEDSNNFNRIELQLSLINSSNISIDINKNMSQLQLFSNNKTVNKQHFF